ncbi:unannotated protein [freshwater metagenome]|uniref:Unannotated protein n=1 Tax=freshwater metagenome TaxID=449393 RepID=A0A6J6JLI1_9ZZZZ
MECYNFPTVAVETAVTDHFVNSFSALVGGIGRRECRGHARSSDWLDRVSVSLGEGFDSEDVEKCREDVRDVRVLMSQSSTVEPPGLPRNEKWHGMPAGMSVDLVEPEGRIARHGPTARVVGRCLWPAYEINAREVGLDVVAFMTDMGHVCAGADHFAFPRGSVVRSEDDNCVVEFTHFVERVEESPGVVVDIRDHGSEHFHVARVKLLLVLGKFIPRLNIIVCLGVTRSQHDIVAKDVEFFLASKAA